MTEREVLDAINGPASDYAAALISVSWFSELSFAESVICNACCHAEPLVRGAAITAIGHLARIHKDLSSTRRLVEQLEEASKDEDPRVRGKVEAALDDIEVFVPALMSEVSRIRKISRPS